MKIYILLFSLSLSISCLSQNVGIGTLGPSEKLDVGGNLNVQGNIKINSVGGTSGQALMTNSSGATAWVDMCDYKNVLTFTSSTSWIAPSNINTVVVELWGGGGGGASGGGGAGGTYIRINPKTVVAGTAYPIVVGSGGSGATSESGFGNNGSSSSITFGGLTYTALSGSGGTPTTGGSAGAFGLSGDSFLQWPGESGKVTSYSYAERISGQFVEIRKYGDGGGAGPDYSNGGPGGNQTIVISTLTAIKTSPPSYISKYGSGGGGGFDPSGSTWGKPGSIGLVVIHY